MKITINKKLFINYMKENNVTLTQLAHDAGTTVSALSKFLNGYNKNIKSTTLTGLLEAMNMDETNIGRVFNLKKKLPAGKRGVEID